MNNRFTTCILAAIASIVLSQGTQAAEAIPMPPTLDAQALGRLLPQFQAGGHIFYFRHASTRHDQEDKQPVDLSSCDKQRNLSESGKTESRSIGDAFKRLHIPVGLVVSSPYCRTLETARLAFGRAEVSDDLHFAIGLPKAEVSEKALALRKMLATVPAQGVNSVIVSHTANLQEAVGLWPKPEAVAFIFKPDAAGNLVALGRVPPELWSQLGR